jgi:hypothetical protein
MTAHSTYGILKSIWCGLALTRADRHWSDHSNAMVFRSKAI